MDNKEMTLTEDAQKQIAEIVKGQFNDEMDKFYSQKEDKVKKEMQVKKDALIGEGVEAKSKHNTMLRAFIQKDFQTLSLMKDYLRTSSNADGGYLVPPADFVKTIYDLEEEYGVARADATILQVNSNSATIPYLAERIAVSTTSQGSAKPVSTPTWGQKTVSLIKKTALVPMTEEMIEDSAFDIMSIVADQFATEFAQAEDELVFTDGTSGIVNQVGIDVVHTSTTAITSVTFDNINEMIYNVPSKSRRGGKFYMNAKVLGVVQRLKDSNNQYIWQPNVNGAVEGAIWGYPVVLTEVLPSTLTANANVGYIVFGNLKYVTIAEKGSIKLTTLTEGTITDGETTYALAQQDMIALRGVKRLNAVCVMPSAFSVLTTAHASS